MTFEEMRAEANDEALYIWSESGTDMGIGTVADACALKADGLITDHTEFRRA